MKLNLSLKNRSLSFYLEAGAGILAILAAVVYIIIDKSMIAGTISFDDSSILTMVFLLVGGVLSVGHALTGLPFANILGAIALGAGVGQHIYMCCFPWADLATGVAFFCNSETRAILITTIYTIFLALFLVSTILSVVSTFTHKEEK